MPLWITVRFGARASSDGGFGESTIANTASAAYTYKAAGNFNVSLTVVDAEGLSHRKSSSITIDPAPVNTPPNGGLHPYL